MVSLVSEVGSSIAHRSNEAGKPNAHRSTFGKYSRKDFKRSCRQSTYLHRPSVELQRKTFSCCASDEHMHVREPYHRDIAKFFGVEVRGKSAANNRKGVNMW